MNDQWLLETRGPKAVLDPQRAYAAVWEEERDAAGEMASTAVVFLTNRECPFRCVMCDLWMNTLDQVVPAGAIVSQLRAALAALPPARHIKLYNAGSFFDPLAIPPDDDQAIADLLAGCRRVIVEAHPAYLRGPYADRCLRFRDRLEMPRNAEHGPASLEVAVGLEAADEHVLRRLDKRMTLADFCAAIRFLCENRIAARAFILLQPPFVAARDAMDLACRSIDFAFDAGAQVCSIIPTRSPNGSAAPAATGPSLLALEAALEYGVAAARGRVFADLWDVRRLFTCRCSPARARRLREMNDTQCIPPPVACDCAVRH